MSDICRICRKSTQVTNSKQLFDTERNALVVKIELITGEWLNYEQGWPCSICIRCEDELNVAAAFRERCIQTQQELRLELVAGEAAKPDHLDPLNIIQCSQNDKEFTIHDPSEYELIIKDEHLDNEDPDFILDYCSVKPPAEFVVCNEQNGMQKTQDQKVLQNQVQTCTDNMSEMKTNQVQKSEVNTHLKEANLKKTTSDFVCGRCRKHFMNERKLNNHLNRNKCKIDFECNICKKSVTTKQALKDHELIHTGRRNYHCKLCDESFNLLKILKRHELSKRHKNREEEKNHQQEKNQTPDAKRDEQKIPYEHTKDILCTKESVADEHFEDRDSPLILNDVGTIYKNKLTGEGLLQNELELIEIKRCEIDTKNTSYQSSQHTKPRRKWGVTTEKQFKKTNFERKNGDFVCDICGKHYKHKWTLKDHLLRHTGVKDFVCNKCKKKFSTKYELMTHEEIHTSEQNYHCGLCDESFKMYKYLKRHERSNKHISKTGTLTHEQLMEKKSEINVENFICDQCGKQFPHKKYFMEHLHRHRGIKDFECNICKKRFALKAELQKHLDTVHAGIKRFSCKYCDMKFKYTQTKTYHQRKFHTFQLPFKCRYCDKAFITGYKCKSHELVHSNIRNFHCELCDVYFKQYTGLKNHMYSQKHKSKEKECINNQS